MEEGGKREVRKTGMERDRGRERMKETHHRAIV